MTAIEWLMEEITYACGGGARHNSFIDTVDLSEYFNKAKEMEKQQIIDAHLDGQSLVSCKDEYAVQYYIDTFKNKQ